MIVRSLADLIDSEMDFKSANGNWSSRRLLLKKDGMGFSLHDTVIHAGTSTEMWYKHHAEAVYCIEGEGVLHDLSNHHRYSIKAGTMYALDGNEKHVLTATTEMRMICIFNPPCTGREDHDDEGAYPLLD